MIDGTFGRSIIMVEKNEELYFYTLLTFHYKIFGQLIYTLGTSASAGKN